MRASAGERERGECAHVVRHHLIKPLDPAGLQFARHDFRYASEIGEIDQLENLMQAGARANSPWEGVDSRRADRARFLFWHDLDWQSFIDPVGLAATNQARETRRSPAAIDPPAKSPRGERRRFLARA